MNEMPDLIVWLYYKFLKDGLSAREILVKWENEKKEWMKHQNDPYVYSTYETVLDNYSRSISFLKKYII